MKHENSVYVLGCHGRRGEWPPGLRRCSKNRKVLGSNPARSLAGLRDPTLLRSSRWPSGRKCKTQWLTSGYRGCHLDNGRKLAVWQYLCHFSTLCVYKWSAEWLLLKSGLSLRSLRLGSSICVFVRKLLTKLTTK